MESSYTLDDVIWDAGEVEWEFNNYNDDDDHNEYNSNYHMNHKKFVDKTNTEIAFNNNYHPGSTRESIWYYIEKSNLQAGLSGFMKGIYSEFGAKNTIIEDIQNFDIHDIVTNKSLFEVMFLLTILFMYNGNNVLDIEMQEISNMDEYMHIRKKTTIFTICAMIIFVKNVKSCY
jgi:penicillin-binding protein-related factor A (putative recombinase)